MGSVCVPYEVLLAPLTSHGLSMASYRPTACSLQPAQLIVLDVSKPYVIRTDQYNTYMCTLRNPYRVHLQDLASRWPNTRTPIDRPYASNHTITGGGFRMDFPRGTGLYGFPSRAYNRRFEVYSSMCRRPA